MIERLYRLLLALLPRDFRERFGAEMLDTARALDADRPRSPRRTARVISDAILTPIALRAELRADARLAGQTRKVPMESFLRDVRFALRGLRREPAFTAFVAITLALGIGANAAMFGIADRLLLRGPAHVREADRVVRVYFTEQPPGMRVFTTSGFGHVTYDLLRQGATAFEQVATYAINDVVAGQGADARQVRAGYTTAGFFPLLGVQPALGRFFTEHEDTANAAARVAVLSHSAWMSWFGGSQDAIGRTVTLGDESYEVIGGAPPGFTGAELGRVDVWVPGNVKSARITSNWATTWNAQWLKIVARLKPGVTFEQAGLDATGAHRRAYTGGDAWTAEGRLSVASLGANDAGNDATEVRVLRWLTWVAALVLLIACANIANLLLARGKRRHREVAIRAALGASRLRIVRLLLIESILLAFAGAAAGVVVTYAIGGLARQALFTSIEWTSSPVNARVLMASAAFALATGLLVGLLPALRSTRTAGTDALRTGPREGGGRRSALRTALTIVQAALSVLLLIGAGLFVRSLWNVRALDLGIDPDRVMVIGAARSSLARIPDGPEREAERARRRTFYLDTLDRVRALPGVEAAAVAVGLPFGDRFSVELRVPAPDAVPRLKGGGPGVSAVSAGYFETVGTRLLRGRAFTAEDRAGTEPVAIVSDLMAKTVWPGAEALGKCLLVGSGTPPCARVVGVAANTYRSRLREDPVMHYYIPAGQEVGFGGSALIVRGADRSPNLGPFSRSSVRQLVGIWPYVSRSSPVFPDEDVRTALVADVRRLLTGLDTTISYISAETIQARIEPQVRPWTLGATVFLLSGLLALIVAGIGIYSVMSYLIADRRREIGVRMALGATAADIVRLVLRGSLLMAVVGIAIGEVVAALLGRFAEPLLFETSPRDPAVFAGVAGLLLAVAMAATFIPARRARSVNPVEALRTE
ncbi:MAG TPA: ABC transporter permease [Vicinamibacterales bacterium]|nr:ABC transporter permease [Vicinamibacterales bacterium]